MSRHLLLAILLFSAAASAQEIVTLKTREDVTQSFFIANMGDVMPEAVALLFIGGGGNIHLHMEQGRARFSTGNFLPRARAEFIRNGILPVILDNSSDTQAGEGMSDAFRESAAHAADIRAIVAEMKRRYPGLPVFLVGTSRSTISMAHLAKRMGGEVAGAVLSSSMWRLGRSPALAAFDWSDAKVPLLFVHHRDDACEWTSYQHIPRGVAAFPLVSVRGGKAPESGPCDPFAPHGFFGKEAETVEAIAGWMLNKPYRREID